MSKENTLPELLKQKAELEQKIANATTDQVAFSVDAGIINRLGKELVGRPETAVSELVKNAYDADANSVKLNFVDSELPGGTLIIEDNGHGMDFEELIKGFMRLSSSDKIHNPVSPKHKRIRAGKKGIGRFATQRLGNKLVIKTKKENATTGIRLNVNWSDYSIDKNIGNIFNPVSEWLGDISSGTIIEIHELYEGWTDAQIRRVYRYVLELLQPSFLSDRSKGVNIRGERLKIATQKEGSFSVSCYRTTNNITTSVINEDSLVFDRAVAVIEGYIDKDKDGYCSVVSDRFSIDDPIIPIGSEKKPNSGYSKWKTVHNVYFKAYYFIYNRPNYYTSMTKMELKKIQDLSARLGSIRLYRNGFRVLPYGEPYNDWLKLDSRNRNRSGVNAPLGNNNFFGFVEVVDPQGDFFEETASREGLLENDALSELRDFVFKALAKGRDIVAESLKAEKDNSASKKREADHGDKSTDELFDELEKLIDEDSKEESENNEKNSRKENVREKVQQIKKDFKKVVEELGMLRIWAGLGLSIGDFTHDVIQFTSALGGYLSTLGGQSLDAKGEETLDMIEDVFKSFRSYIAFFDTGASIAEARNMQPVDLIKISQKFMKIIQESQSKDNIEILPIEIYDSYELISTPMHPTEWYSILFNLFSNSKKALIRKGGKGQIKLILGQEKDKIYLEFLDNGDGIPEENKERIFNAFFSTSTPAGIDSSETDQLTGRGLGLKLIKDTLEVYKGDINLIDTPDIQFSTCFRIEIPSATKEQLLEYGY